MKPIAARLLSDAKPVPQRRTFLAAVLGTALGAAVSIPLRQAHADAAWPTRTVRFITLAAPGAGTDAVARTLADALSRRWAQPVVIDNRPGGEGIVSIETFLAAREGNHTLLFNPIGAWTALPLMHEQLTFDPVRDLIPLYFVVQDFIALAASPLLGAITLAALVAKARAEPGKLTWACAPSVPFLAFTAFLRGTGLDLTYVPYRNPIAALPDLAEGRVDLAFLPLAPLIGPAQAGKLRLVAVASDDRAPLAPDVPTARQAGFPTLSLFGGHGLFAPKEMPEPLRARIAGDLRATLADAEVARRLTAMGYIPRTEFDRGIRRYTRSRAHALGGGRADVRRQAAAMSAVPTPAQMLTQSARWRPACAGDRGHRQARCGRSAERGSANACRARRGYGQRGDCNVPWVAGAGWRRNPHRGPGPLRPDAACLSAALPRRRIRSGPTPSRPANAWSSYRSAPRAQPAHRNARFRADLRQLAVLHYAARPDATRSPTR